MKMNVTCQLAYFFQWCPHVQQGLIQMLTARCVMHDVFLWSMQAMCRLCTSLVGPAAGLADLNHCDLNHWFKSRFKSIDFFVKKSSDLNHTDDFTYQWKIIINRSKCIVLFIQLIHVFDDRFYSHWFRNFNSVQHELTCLRDFSQSWLHMWCFAA